jgi:hypothetical protein
MQLVLRQPDSFGAPPRAIGYAPLDYLLQKDGLIIDLTFGN